MCTFACSDTRVFVSPYCEMEAVKGWWGYTGTFPESLWGQGCDRNWGLDPQDQHLEPGMSCTEGGSHQRLRWLFLPMGTSHGAAPWLVQGSGQGTISGFSKGRIWHCSINDDVKEVQRKDRKKKIAELAVPLGWKVTINSEECNL